jgi:hypothetical protein
MQTSSLGYVNYEPVSWSKMTTFAKRRVRKRYVRSFLSHLENWRIFEKKDIDGVQNALYIHDADTSFLNGYYSLFENTFDRDLLETICIDKRMFNRIASEYFSDPRRKALTMLTQDEFRKRFKGYFYRYAEVLAKVKEIERREKLT